LFVSGVPVIFDLHSHTHFSDGRLSPADLLQRAKERQVSVLAVTDHDTIAGLPGAQQAAQALGVKLVGGIEFSSRWGKVNVHVIGLGINPASPELKAAVEHQEQARIRRAEAIAERLAKSGIPDALEGARAIAGNATVGRPHFAQFLVATGAVKSINAAFKKFLGTGKPADVKYEWPDIETVISWIKTAEGLAVLAHPAKYDLTRRKICALVADFAAAGGDAIEVINGIQQSTLTQDLARITSEHSLYASCGSDFHFPDQPWQELGQFGVLPAGITPVWEAPRFQQLLALA
jgi:predicted metal-dependent phosphoesterase TrpH